MQAVWKFIIGFCFVLCIVAAIWSGSYFAGNQYRTKIREVENNLRGLEYEIRASNNTIEQLKTDNQILTDISRKWTERDSRIAELYKLVEDGNRREEEITRSIAGGIGRIEGGFIIIKSNITLLGSQIDGVGIALDGGLELIREGTDIIRELQGSGGEENAESPNPK